MSLNGFRDMRSYVALLEKEGELFRIQKEVDPIVQMCAISKKMDGGPAILYENVKGLNEINAQDNYLEDIRGLTSYQFGKTLADKLLKKCIITI